MLGPVESWRDTATEQAQDDLDGLLGAALPFAEQTLAKHGEMFPFGAGVDSDGHTRMLAADPSMGARPPSEDVLGALYAGARSDASLRAVAFVADVRFQTGDAIRVDLEHREGVTLQVLIPYSRSRLRKNLTLGDMRVSRGEARIWGE
jgi:hypothetical protein